MCIVKNKGMTYFGQEDDIILGGEREVGDFTRKRACVPPDSMLWCRQGAEGRGGWPHPPKGGEADACYVTYWDLYGHDYCKTQKPPPRQVTVSISE